LHSLIPNLLRRLRSDERGFILATSVIVLLVLLLTMTAYTLAASNNTTTASHTGSSAQALAAAQAGEQAALFRVNNAPGSGGASSGNGTLGDGATYSYTVTSLTSSSSPCTGLYVSSPNTLNQDCISSTGTANGVKQTVEERIAGYVPQTSLFPVNGIFAISGLSTTQISGTFSLGSNGTLSLTDANLSALSGQIEYLAGDLQQSQNAGEQCTGTCTPVVESSPGITVPSVADSVYAGAKTTNSDMTGITLVNASYSSSTYILTATNNSASATFSPGTYYFCGINVGGFSNFALNTTGSGIVRIYIDSSYRSGSPCTAGLGTIYGAGNSTASINSSGTSSNLQLYFYGQPGCTGTSCPPAITNMNATTMVADVFAPNSYMDPTSLTLDGALVVGDLTDQGALTATYQQPSSSGSGSGSSTFYPTATAVCPNSYATTGC
jgi:Tfp pilus assembly protein PilX